MSGVFMFVCLLFVTCLLCLFFSVLMFKKGIRFFLFVNNGFVFYQLFVATVWCLFRPVMSVDACLFVTVFVLPR